MLSGKQPHKDYLVVDVRDDDREGGHILGSLWAPSHKFDEKAERFAEKTKGIPILIFHCALSQVRGPRTARTYAEIRDRTRQPNDIPQEIYVLRGGFSLFQAMYHSEPELVEGWSKEVWDTDEWRD